jgi:hypothetical protein
VKRNPTGKYYMIDAVAPEDYEIVVVHPTRYPKLLGDENVE